MPLCGSDKGRSSAAGVGGRAAVDEGVGVCLAVPSSSAGCEAVYEDTLTSPMTPLSLS